ncbi:MAG: inositol monophosphatase [Lentisphaerae bacterium]|jgi:myo-inositol-1(or 4)-monophosphatase|nr:inositol monophosphatase [Lentisphaerota bacterium]MBT4818055.1 inositol monophosphatase [Lentisphaerota bacterium]MBT5610235.1 inositol monophosphatase [Lentisphaerota bacterium]MBT7055704.1 inositol monophosphatase [Lentisphaerota bacterium]MBT7845999.1 inositol monophosphatase [Lentisphaerota bacterium]
MMDRLLRIAKQAGEISRRHFGRLEARDVQLKGEVDLVTAVDRELELFLRERLGEAFPDVSFYGEEGDYGELDRFERVFVVDPLDGTTSFVHAHPFYSISIALREGRETTAGLVYLPYFDQAYWAVKGQGAFRDGERIRVSTTAELVNCLAATGFACVRARNEQNNLPLFCDLMPQIRGIRRCGSAAIDLCYVADGHYDFFWEYNLSPWDIAAGALIVSEAGGKVSDLAGERELMGAPHVLASNAVVHDAVLEVSRRYAADC